MYAGKINHYSINPRYDPSVVLVKAKVKSQNWKYRVDIFNFDFLLLIYFFLLLPNKAVSPIATISKWECTEPSSFYTFFLPQPW